MKKLSVQSLSIEKRAIDFIKQMVSEGNISQRVVDKYFPELRENQDERIRKELLEHCINRRDGKQVCVDASDYRRWANWLKKQGKQTSLQTNEHAWLYLVADILTWKDGIGQYLDDPRVQELAKKLQREYAQKLYNADVREIFPEPKEDKDRRIRKALMFILKSDFEKDTMVYDISVGDIIDWLGKIPPQNRWTPSNKQIEALQYVYQNLNPLLSDKRGWDSLKTLELMYRDLKKLRNKNN